MVIPVVVCGSQGCIAGMVISDGDFHKGTKVCRYNWHSAGSLGWPFPMLKYKYTLRIKYTEVIYQTTIGNCYRLKLPNADCSLKDKFIVSFKSNQAKSLM